MAYTKQTWVDGTSIANAERLNHIEDGIYENSVKLNDTGWIEATLEQGYTTPALASAGKLMYRRIGNVVYIKGSISGFTAFDGIPCCHIPTGFRPPTRICINAEYTGSHLALFRLSSGGDLALNYNQGETVTSSQWYNLTGSFVTDDTFPTI